MNLPAATTKKSSKSAKKRKSGGEAASASHHAAGAGEQPGVRHKSVREAVLNLLNFKVELSRLQLYYYSRNIYSITEGSAKMGFL